MLHISRSNIWNDHTFDFLLRKIHVDLPEFADKHKVGTSGYVIPHTPLKGEVICECQGEKHKSS